LSFLKIGDKILKPLGNLAPRFKIRFLVLLFAILLPRTGVGLTDRFAAFDLWPSVGDRYFVGVSSSQGLYKNQYSFGLSNAFVLHPLDLLDPTGTRLGSVVDYYFGHFLSAGFGITDFWQAGLTLPIFSAARFEDPTIEPSQGKTSVHKIGDIRLTSKIRVLDAIRRRFGLAFEPFVTIPLGADDSFLGESSVTGGFRAIGDVQITRRLRLALNLGAELRGERVLINNIDFSHRFLTGLGVAVDIARGISFSGEAQANPSFGNFFTEKDTTPVELTGTFQWDIGNTGFKVGVGGGSCLICGAKAGIARGFLNVSYRRMGDVYTLKERQDARMMLVTLKGGKEFLEAYEIYELTDKCPIDPSKYDINRDDPRCTEIYELQQVARDCPSEEEFDIERDNLKCLQFYSLRKHDSDKDDVPDFLDWCPTEGGSRDDRGCPTMAYLVISPEKGQILTQTINFEFGKARLRPDAIPILDAVAGALHTQPSIKLLSIEGHTDEVGTEEQNNALSYARARTVYNYLIDHGINSARLAYKGFGKRKPIADNKTEEGRARNRRVEFVIKKVGEI
jgi:outer membrane protein OmpA-like peptidoglycan-associated protein